MKEFFTDDSQPFIEKAARDSIRRWKEKAFDENGFYDSPPQSNARDAMTEAELMGLDKKPMKENQALIVARETETISSVYAMLLRAGSLFSEMIQGKISGYRVEMDRTNHPTKFHIRTWI